MKVFVVGASGAIGSRLVPQLIERGHEVIGSARSPDKVQRLRRLGAESVVLDALDARAVREALAAAQPDAVVHQATALTGISDLKHFDRTFAQTNRLRTEGTDNLLAAAREAGVGKFVAQSNANHRYAREGGPVKSEGDPLDPRPVAAMRASVAAMNYVDEAVPGAGGIALRYGIFYGDPDDGLVQAVRARKFPVVGDGAGVWSFIHLDDAAAATVLAARARRPRRLQHRRRRALTHPRVAAGACEDRRGQVAPAFPAPGRPALRGRGAGRDGHRVARRVERQGQARARLDPALPELAARLR
ncbi:MAG: NAD(P)-dependent oxidoreductase [Gaiellaceae bacterium MAG52_C11]|nr:NAD(P)-dependent oxidoreductase [Candidatus Gaiellasilicea maunaloa]